MIGLPNDFPLGPEEKPRKGEKRTYYCDLCLVELNSYDTMNSHVRGAKHMKKEMAIVQESKDKVNMGMMTEEEAERERPKVKVIPNLESVKKIPTRLHEKVREAMDPVVGLKYITEIMPSSNLEMEPHCQRELCGALGQANGMMGHLMGTKHREMFLDTKVGM